MQVLRGYGDGGSEVHVATLWTLNVVERDAKKFEMIEMIT